MPKKEANQEEKPKIEFDLELPTSETYKKSEKEILSEFQEKLKYQDKQIDMLWQNIKQKGLDVGMPTMIMSDMAEIMSIIETAVSLWDDNRTMESEILQDGYINKLRDNGDLITAESMRHSQVLRLREVRITIKNFIISMREALRRMQKRMQE